MPIVLALPQPFQEAVEAGVFVPAAWQWMKMLALGIAPRPTVIRFRAATTSDRSAAESAGQTGALQFAPLAPIQLTSTAARRAPSRAAWPSYVELLTCLEVAKQSKELPDTSGMKGKVGR